MCGKVEMWISTNRALVAKKSENVIFPSFLSLRLPYGMFLFVTQREHAKFCAKVRKKSQICKS